MKTRWIFFVLGFSMTPAAFAAPSWCSDSCLATSVQACASLKALHADSGTWETLCSAPVQADGSYSIVDGDGTMKEDLLLYGDGGVGIFVSGGSDLDFSPYRKLIAAPELNFSPDQIPVSADTTAEASATDPVMKQFFSNLASKLQKQLELKGAPLAKVDDSNVNQLLQAQSEISSISADASALDRETVKKWVALYLQDFDRFEQYGTFADLPQGASEAADLVLAMNDAEKDLVFKQFWNAFDARAQVDEGTDGNELRKLFDLLLKMADRTQDPTLYSKVKDRANLDQILFKPIEALGLKFNYENSKRVNPELVSFVMDV